MTGFVKYWVFPQDGDPLPNIGSGFRIAEVMERSNGSVVIKGFTVDQNLTLTAKEWNEVPHIPHNPDQKWSVTLHLLRGYRPAKPCEACKK